MQLEVEHSVSSRELEQTYLSLSDGVSVHIFVNKTVYSCVTVRRDFLQIHTCTRKHQFGEILNRGTLGRRHYP